MFAKLLEKEKDVILTAVAEPVYASRQLAFTRFGVPLSRCYEDADEFFAQGKICDAVFICTQDAQHCQMTLRQSIVKGISERHNKKHQIT